MSLIHRGRMPPGGLRPLLTSSVANSAFSSPPGHASEAHHSPRQAVCQAMVRRSMPSSRRHFHAADVGAAAVEGLAHSLSAIHQAGLPWYLTLPLLAVGFDLTIRLPLQYYARTVQVKRQALNKLAIPWMQRQLSVAARKAKPEDSRDDIKKRAVVLNAKTRRRLYTIWGYQRWKSFALVFGHFAPFIFIMETVRQLTGRQNGILSNFLFKAIPEDGFLHAATLLDTSLRDGGLAWFVDLTARDPYFILPLISSAIIAARIFRRQKPKELLEMLRTQRSTRLILLTPILPLLIADFPSAIFVFWITSSIMTDVNDAVLERLLPLRSKGQKLPRRNQTRPYLQPPPR